MHIFNLEINGYENADRDCVAAIREQGREAWDALGRDVIQHTRWPSFEEVTKDEKSYWSFECVATVEQVQALTDYGLRVRATRVRGMFYDKDPQQLLRAVSAAKSEVHVHVPGGVALTSVRKVDWLEDACTQELQGRLDEGWRIIAVCPPNDARRPTYILGRE